MTAPRYVVEPRQTPTRQPGWQVRDTRPAHPEADTLLRTDTESSAIAYAEAYNRADATPLPWTGWERLPAACLGLIRASLARHYMDKDWSKTPIKFGTAIARTWVGRKPAMVTVGHARAICGAGYAWEVSAGSWADGDTRPIDPAMLTGTPT